MITRQTRAEYLARLGAEAREAFAGHVIRSTSGERWLCFRPREDGGFASTYWFEAVVLGGGELYVHGDISGVHFAHHGSGTPEAIVRWIGGHPSVDGYIAEKAAIGMNLPTSAEDVLTALDDGVWFDDAIRHLEETGAPVSWEHIRTTKDIGDPPLCIGQTSFVASAPPWLVTVLDDLSRGSDPRDLVNELRDSHQAYEAGALTEWGRVPSARLVYAHGALARLVALLDEGRAR